MTAKYTVVQYVPRPLADERVNIGLIAWDKNGAVFKFTDDWARTRALGGDETQLLKQITRELQAYILSSGTRAGHDDDLVQNLICRWEHKVQFTAQRGSLRPAQELLRELSTVFLPHPRVRRARGRTRRSAVSLALKVARKAAVDVAPANGANLVKSRYVVEGKLDTHRFDVALANGHLLGAINALSFDAENAAAVSKDVDASAWAFDDIHKANPQAPMGVFLLPARTAETRREYARAVKVFEGLGATVFEDQPAMQDWVGGQLREYA